MNDQDSESTNNANTVRTIAESDASLIIGHGEMRFTVDQSWGLVGDAHAPVFNAHALVEDCNGQIYLITDHPDNAYLVYEKDGTFVRAFGDLPGGHGLDLITLDGEEYLIHVDAGWHVQHDGSWVNGNGGVSIVDKQGQVVRRLPTPVETEHFKPDEQFKPCNTAVTADNDILVVDAYATDRVVHYRADGTILNIWGGHKPGEPDHLSNAHGISIDDSDPHNPVVWISSRDENKIKLFTLEGHYLETLSFPGAYVGRALFHDDKVYIGVCWSKQDGVGPMLDESGFLLVLDRETRKVISAPGGTEPVYKEGILQPMHQQAPVFKHVHELYVDAEDAVYVCEWNAGGRYPYKLTPVAE